MKLRHKLAEHSVCSLPLKGGGQRRPSAAVFAAENADAKHRLWWGSHASHAAAV